MSRPISIQTYDSPFGPLIIGSYNDQICLCDWKYRKKRSEIDKRIQMGLSTDFEEQSTPIHNQAISQLDAYFEGELQKFELPMLFTGSDFQKKVWKALLQIPYGKTLSYLELSEQLGNTKAIRAVAAANGANAISILIPCHRIIGQNGALTGYAGGLEAKKQLLALENPDRKKQLQLFEN